MATFTTFANILPDPAHPITDAGDTSVSGTPGPGFSAVNFSSVTDTQVSRTVSGRGVSRDGGSQHWEFSISYNPMFRPQFDPIDTFLAGRNPRRDPFYVILPQYSKPKTPAFATFAAANVINIAGAQLAGASQILMSCAADFSSFARPGDMFTITDGADFNHQKVYKITAVETNAYYQAATTQPTVKQMRVKISPPLQRDTANLSVVNFIEPKFRVITKSDVQEHSLNTDNLYSFSLALEEFMP